LFQLGTKSNGWHRETRSPERPPKMRMTVFTGAFVRPTALFGSFPIFKPVVSTLQIDFQTFPLDYRLKRLRAKRSIGLAVMLSFDSFLTQLFCSGLKWLSA
jgi:hypothetical protein